MVSLTKNTPLQDDPETEPTHDESGVDLTLIRWMLSMTPAERLQTLQHTARSILRIRGDYPSET